MSSIVLRFFALAAVAAAAGSMLASPAHAQQVYRIVGPDGKVTFSDKPPPPASNARVTAATNGSSGGAAASALPFELRQVVSRYPVTLYTADNCGPCGSARAMLTARGVPFTEKTVKTSEDSEALQRLSGDSSLPFATIGSQQLKGFSDAEWTQFLNAAGYPAVSVLPATYRQAAATPLVAVSAAPPAAAARPAGPPANAAAPPQASPAGDNPAGIRF